MNKIVGSVENWESGILGMNSDTAQIANETVDIELGLVNINVKISHELDEQLTAVAKDLGLIKPAVVRHIIDQYIKAH